MTLAVCEWPLARLGEALKALAERSRLGTAAVVAAPTAPPQTTADDTAALDRWLGATAAGLSLETEAIEAPLGEVDQVLRHAAPAILPLPGGKTFLLLDIQDGTYEAQDQAAVTIRDVCGTQTWGFRAGGLGDVNGDGFADFFIDRQSPECGDYAGRPFVFFGGTHW